MNAMSEKIISIGNGVIFVLMISWIISLGVTIYFGWKQYEHVKDMRWADERINKSIYISAGITALLLFFWAMVR